MESAEAYVAVAATVVAASVAARHTHLHTYAHVAPMMSTRICVSVLGY